MSGEERARRRKDQVDSTMSSVFASYLAPPTKAFVDTVAAGQWERAAALYNESPTWDQRLDFLIRATDNVDSAPGIDAWADAWEGHPLPLIARGLNRITIGWSIRSSGSHQSVSEDHFEQFVAWLRLAEDDLMRATVVVKNDPTPWHGLIITARALQAPLRELKKRHDRASTAAPQLFASYMQTLQGLCGKWSGTDKEMVEFARSVSNWAPEGSPLHALVPMAFLEGMISNNWSAQQFAERAREEIVYEASRSIHHDAFDDRAEKPGALEARHVFLAAFGLCKETALAQNQAEAIDGRILEFPLIYVAPSDVRSYYERLRFPTYAPQ